MMERMVRWVKRDQLMSRCLPVGWLLILYIAGIALWGYFFSWGRFPLDFHDWAEVNAPRLALAQDAVKKGVFPLHINVTWPLRGITDRYLSIPDTLVSPQILLLRFLDIPSFVLTNQLLLYSIGFVGLIWLKRHLHLSAVGFTLLYLVFNFNGHIVSHLSIGHISWGGYYLYPWFAGSVLVFIQSKSDLKWAAGLGVVLAVTMLQGSFHQFTWMLLFLGFLGIGVWKKILWLALGAAFGGLLALFRLLPPILLLGQFDDEYKGGYSNPLWILKSLLTDLRPDQAMSTIFPTSPLGWWEFDQFIGISAGIIVSCGLLIWIFRAYRERAFPTLLIPMIGLSFLSITKIYAWFRLIPIPLLSGERVASRMFSLVLLFACVTAIQELDFWLAKHPEKRFWRWVYWGGGSITAVELVSHMLPWAVARAYPFFPNTPVDLSLIHVANRTDPVYVGLIIGGGILSATTAILLLWFLRKRV